MKDTCEWIVCSQHGSSDLDIYAPSITTCDCPRNRLHCVVNERVCKNHDKFTELTLGAPLSEHTYHCQEVSRDCTASQFLMNRTPKLEPSRFQISNYSHLRTYCNHLSHTSTTLDRTLHSCDENCSSKTQKTFSLNLFVCFRCIVHITLLW